MKHYKYPMGQVSLSAVMPSALAAPPSTIKLNNVMICLFWMAIFVINFDKQNKSLQTRLSLIIMNDRMILLNNMSPIEYKNAAQNFYGDIVLIMRYL
jgi:hypothetical protein